MYTERNNKTDQWRVQVYNLERMEAEMLHITYAFSSCPLQIKGHVLVTSDSSEAYTAAV